MMTRIKTTPQQIKRELKNLVEVSLHEALRRVFGRVEKHMFDQAEHVREKSGRKALFSAIAHGRTGQKQFYQAVFQQLLDAKRSQSAPDEWFKLTRDRSAAIKLEDSLNAAHSSTSGEHAQYLARIEHLTEQTYEVPNGLYSLEAIARAVLEQSKQLPPLMQKTFINMFIEQGVGQISPIYSILNDYLIQVGLLPTIKRIQADNEPSGAQIAGGLTSASAFVEAMIDRISELLEEQISGEPAAIFNFDQDSDWTVSHFSGFIKQQIAPDLPDAHWPAKPADIIHVVGVTLADILNDSMIDPLFRAQIGRLQMAVLLTATQNRHFLADPNHPLRRILNCLASLGATPGQEQTLDSVIPLVDQTLESTLQQTGNLNEIAEGIETIAKQAGNQPREDQGGERMAPVVSRCRERVEMILKAQTAHTPLKPITEALVWSALSPFMVRTMINQGRNNQFWSNIINVLKEALALQLDMPISTERAGQFASHIRPLLESDDEHVQPTQEERAIIERFIEALNEQPSKTAAKPAPVKSSAEQPVETDSRFPANKPNAARAKATPKPTRTETKATPKTRVPAPETLQPNQTDEKTEPHSFKPTPAAPEEQRARKPTKWFDEPRIAEIFQYMIRSGEWFEVYTGSGRAVRRLKMRVVDPQEQLVHFANRTGQTILSLPVAQVIDDLTKRRTRLVFDGPVFKRLIDELDQLQKRLVKAQQEGL